MPSAACDPGGDVSGLQQGAVPLFLVSLCMRWKAAGWEIRQWGVG